MTHEETLILDFLSERPETVFARKEIARKAVKRTVYEENPRWADQPLASLVAQDLIEIDEGGLYKYRKSGYTR